MDLSELNDLNRGFALAPDALHSSLLMPPVDAPPAHWWQATVRQLSAETAGPLTSALERVQTLASTGRIDRSSLRALCAEIQRARQVGMAGQQLARLTSDRLPCTPERVRVSQVLQDLIEEHTTEIEARGLRIQLALPATEVVVDAALLYNLLEALLTWSLACAATRLHVTADRKAWPSSARLHFTVERRTTAPATTDHGLDTLSWRLVEQTARALRLPLDRQVKGATVGITLEFPTTVHEAVEGLTAFELGPECLPTAGSRSVVGSQVLVVASRRDVRLEVRNALRNLDLTVDFVASVEEARQFCRGGLPDALVIEAALRGDRFNDLRHELEQHGGHVAFIEIVEEGHAFEISGFGGLNISRVGRDGLGSALPSALLFELAKTD